MLFDLRGGGRRRVIQAVYLSLAILMGGGLVLFGIGGNVSGGLVDALQDNQSSDSSFGDRVKDLEKRVAARPQDKAAWAELARARFQEASSGDGYDQNAGAFTDKGKEKLRGADRAWQRHLKLAKDKPDAQVANLMVQVYGPGGLEDLDKATSAMELVVEARPKSYALYAQLATLAYAAGQQRKGDLAADKAVDLAPKDQRNTIKSQLEQASTQAIQQQVSEQVGQGGGGAAAPTITAP